MTMISVLENFSCTVMVYS